jgi:hypothetical protein
MSKSNIVDESNVRNLVTSRVNSTKKIRTGYQPAKDDKPEFNEIRNAVDEIFDNINYFNSLDEYTISIDGRLTSEIMVLNEFKDWVFPLSIRYNPSNIRTEDLLVRNEVKSFKFNYDRYVRACDNFRRFYKSDVQSNKTTLDSLRQHKSLAEVIDKITIDKVIRGKKQLAVDYMNSAFIPIPIKESVSCLFRNDYFNESAECVIKDYINNSFLNN